MSSVSNYNSKLLLRNLDGSKFLSTNKQSRLAIYAPRDAKDRLVRVVWDEPLDRWMIDAPLGTFYLAGPMRGLPLFNFPAFLMASRILTARGLTIKSPAEKDLEAGFDPSRPIEGQNFDIGAAFRWDFQAVIETRGTILLPGWENSTGAKAERVVAQLSQREIYYLDPQFNLVEAVEAEYNLTWTPKAAPLPALPRPM